MTGFDCSSNTLRRFSTVSGLSSTRPGAAAARAAMRSRITSALRSKLTAKETVATSCSNIFACSRVRGKPSIKKRLVSLCLSIAFFRSLTVISSGTSEPVCMCLKISVPRCDFAATSSRMRSPVLRWIRLNSSRSFAHCVPFPLPGPPSTKTTKGNSSLVLRYVGASPETSTSTTGFGSSAGGASTANGMPSSLTPYSTNCLVRWGGANFGASALAARSSLLGLFSSSHLLSHFTAARPFGCTWQSDMRPLDRSCCSVGSTAKSGARPTSGRFLRSMEATADFRKRKSFTSSLPGRGSSGSSGKQSCTSRAADLAEALACTAPHTAGMEPGLPACASCWKTETASRRHSTMMQQGPSQASPTIEAKEGSPLRSR
mmetsp:Transcript_122889/g.333722  ORF Transcript_122889/g.333722 Transcript_122889/m.333722 type:complete len:374 (+) Transcript_122889:2687-3808(+)